MYGDLIVITYRNIKERKGTLEMERKGGYHTWFYNSGGFTCQITRYLGKHLNGFISHWNLKRH